MVAADLSGHFVAFANHGFATCVHCENVTKLIFGSKRSLFAGYRAWLRWEKIIRAILNGTVGWKGLFREIGDNTACDETPCCETRRKLLRNSILAHQGPCAWIFYHGKVGKKLSDPSGMEQEPPRQ